MIKGTTKPPTLNSSDTILIYLNCVAGNFRIISSIIINAIFFTSDSSGVNEIASPKQKQFSLLPATNCVIKKMEKILSKTILIVCIILF
mgnify:FL=1